VRQQASLQLDFVIPSAARNSLALNKQACTELVEVAFVMAHPETGTGYPLQVLAALRAFRFYPLRADAPDQMSRRLKPTAI